MGGVDISNSYWLDIDTPEALEYANKDLDLKSRYA